ncbi:hypothetical protein P3T23_005559 [Paraburkholderia sp. GAS448]|uniref:hypothetical protein n=1 Tax=Paraburkholderia sp. GAS448 TaxID=3035136 RepID=UPI003D249693
MITEPAVGYGLRPGLLFFSAPVADTASVPSRDSKDRVPPNVTALGGLYTQNGTWAAAAGHFHTWDNDRYRYLGSTPSTPGVRAPLDASVMRAASLNQSLSAISLRSRSNLRSLFSVDHVASLLCISLYQRSSPLYG